MWCFKDSILNDSRPYLPLASNVSSSSPNFSFTSQPNVDQMFMAGFVSERPHYRTYFSQCSCLIEFGFLIFWLLIIWHFVNLDLYVTISLSSLKVHLCKTVSEEISCRAAVAVISALESILILICIGNGKPSHLVVPHCFSGNQPMSTSARWRWSWGDWAGGCEPRGLHQTPPPEQVSICSLTFICLRSTRARLKLIWSNMRWDMKTVFKGNNVYSFYIHYVSSKNQQISPATFFSWHRATGLREENRTEYLLLLK